MTDSSSRWQEFDLLLDRVLDGLYTNDDTRRLNETLRTDLEACRHYISYVDLHGRLVWGDGNHQRRLAKEEPKEQRVGSGQRAVGSEQEPGFGVQETGSSNHPSEVPLPTPFPALSIHYPLSTTHSFVGSALFSYMTAAVIVGVGLLIGSMWKMPEYTQLARQSTTRPFPRSSLPSAVGRITGMVDCQWVQSPESRVQSPALNSRPSSLVSLGDTFAISSGLMEIAYDTGAKVILQGPATYEVESKDGGYLALGKLTARMDGAKRQAANPQSLIPNPSPLSTIHYPLPTIHYPLSTIHYPLSTIHYPLFTIRTPTAIVTDLGTEFGVEVSKEGHTTSYVYRGSIRLQAASVDGKAEGAAKVLHEKESARVERSGDQGGENRIVMVVGLSAKPSGFVREIPKRLVKLFDLVDVVAGGDGFSGRRERGIVPTTGQIANALTGPGPQEKPFFGDGKFHRVTGMPFVDGVFIPGGGKDEMQVDSAGHRFDQFRGTANLTWQPVWAGGPMRGQEYPTKIEGVDYNSPGHGQLLLCASNAITFDLEAIRRANPGYSPERFRAVAGNAIFVKYPEFDPLADVRVLVDGEPRFQRREFNTSWKMFPVVVSLRPSDRFLTLAVTDGGDGYSHDHIVFGDPRLELLPVPAKQ
jgi:hypothetical protein